VHVQSTYNVHFRGLLKLRYLHDRIWSYHSRLSWGDLTSQSFSLLWPFHVIFWHFSA
jgi:hypothetical protein